MDLERCGISLFVAQIRHLPGVSDERKTSVSLAIIPTEIRTEELANTSTALVLHQSDICKLLQLEEHIGNSNARKLIVQHLGLKK
jgi:hypothetical protein